MPKAKSKEIVWEGDIYIDRVADLRNDLLNAFDKCEEIHLSLEKVTDFDVPGIQLIFASHKEALLRNKTFIVTGSINPTLERELRRHGLSVETFKTGIAFKNQIIKTSNYSDGDIQWCLIR